MSSNFPTEAPLEAKSSAKLGPEFFRPSTGGKPPLIQLNQRARRKSDPPSEPDEPPSLSEAPCEGPLLMFSPFEHEFFKNHTGNDSISVWHGKVRKAGDLLVPPWSYQIYVTFGPTARSKDIIPWCNSIYDYIMRSAREYIFAGLRLDFTFLPDAPASSCARHYRAEKRARADTNLALVPTYVTQGLDRLDCKKLNVLLMFDNENLNDPGVNLLYFDVDSDGVLEPETELPEGFGQRENRYRWDTDSWVPVLPWIIEPLEELYQFSKVREEIEREFRAAKKDFEQGTEQR